MPRGVTPGKRSSVSCSCRGCQSQEEAGTGMRMQPVVRYQGQQFHGRPFPSQKSSTETYSSRGHDLGHVAHVVELERGQARVGNSGAVGKQVGADAVRICTLVVIPRHLLYGTAQVQAGCARTRCQVLHCGAGSALCARAPASGLTVPCARAQASKPLAAPDAPAVAPQPKHTSTHHLLPNTLQPLHTGPSVSSSNRSGQGTRPDSWLRCGDSVGGALTCKRPLAAAQEATRTSATIHHASDMHAGRPPWGFRHGISSLTARKLPTLAALSVLFSSSPFFFDLQAEKSHSAPVHTRIVRGFL